MVCFAVGTGDQKRIPKGTIGEIAACTAFFYSLIGLNLANDEMSWFRRFGWAGWYLFNRGRCGSGSYWFELWIQAGLVLDQVALVGRAAELAEPVALAAGRPGRT